MALTPVLQLPLPLPAVIVLVGLVVVVVIPRLYYELTTGARRRRMIQEHGCEPPFAYPHRGVLGKLIGWDVVSSLIQSARDGRVNEGNRLRYWTTGKNTVSVRQLMTRSIKTIEPENLKTMLSIRFHDFSLGTARKTHFMPVFGHGIFTTDGAAWERSRALVRPNFTRQQVADLEMFERHMSHLIDAIPRDGSTVDLQELFFAFTMDSATEFLFGQSTNTLAPGLETKSASEFVEAYMYATEAISQGFQYSGLARWIPDPQKDRSIEIIHRFADEIIQDQVRERQSAKPSAEKKRYVFLHALLDQTQDPYILRSELLNILLAGRDTTAGLLSNTWHVLSTRPDIWARLKAEIDQLGGRRPDYGTIKDLKYLKWVFQECLRLMPVVPSNSREAVRDTILPRGGGPDGKSPIFIPKGFTVTYSPWSMHRREDLYGPDALEFRPERWESLRPGWEYLPFNGGPRICVGQQYALMEASYVTVRLIQTFPRIECRGPREWQEQMNVTLSSGVGCKVALFEQ